MPPTARTDNVLVQDAGADTLVYDQLRDTVHTLNPTAAFVYRHADGTRSVAQIASLMSVALGASDDLALTEAALQELARVHLLASTGEVAGAAAGGRRGVSRRQAVQRLGAAAMTMPMIFTITAPTPAMSTSTTG